MVTRFGSAVTLVVMVLSTGSGSSGAAGTAGARPPHLATHATAPAPTVVVEYSAPVSAALQVERGFIPPATRYGPGHLGVDLRAGSGSQVLAAGAGVVRFAGSVAGRGVVVVVHADGVSTEYEPVRPIVRHGDVVARGQPVGVLTGTHAGCPASCLHWGARRDEAYLDPLTLLRRLGVVRLLPWSSAAS